MIYLLHFGDFFNIVTKKVKKHTENTKNAFDVLSDAL